jgi:hypothetical protein
MSDLRKKLIKLAHDNPGIRKDILPLLKKRADFKTSWPDTKSQADDFARQLKQYAKYFPRMAKLEGIGDKAKEAIEAANPKVQEAAKVMAEANKLIKKIK